MLKDVFSRPQIRGILLPVTLGTFPADDARPCSAVCAASNASHGTVKRFVFKVEESRGLPLCKARWIM